jgi:hypothetical protein
MQLVLTPAPPITTPQSTKDDGTVVKSTFIAHDDAHLLISVIVPPLQSRFSTTPDRTYDN